MKRVIYENTNGTYEYHSTQIDFKDEMFRERFQELQESLDGSLIYTDPEDASYGKENDPHVTVCYGLKNETDYFTLRRLFSGDNGRKPFEAFSVELKEIMAFRIEDKPYDVLAVKVDSPALQTLNATIREACKPYISFPDYHPHLTLAYIQKGAFKELEGTEPFPSHYFFFEKFMFCHKDKFKLEVPMV